MSASTIDQQVVWCPSTMVEEFTYLWKIRRFERISSTARRHEYIESPTFSSSNNSLIWSLKLYPRESTQDHSTSINSYRGDSDPQPDSSHKDMIFYLILEENYLSTKPIIHTRFHISVIHDNTSYRKSGYDDYIQFSPGQGWRVVWRRDVFDLDGYINPDGTLTIACDMAVKLTEYKSKADRNTLMGESGEACSRMCEVYERMLEDELFTDVLLSVKGREFPAHRAVLASQSPVFKQMFEQSKDSVHNRVIIADVSAEVIKEMLSFLYTDKMPDKMKELAAELLAVAYKYKLERLKNVCSDVMSRDINVDTAAKYLVFAHIYDAHGLETNAVQFIANHPSQVMSSQSWQLLKDYPKLLADLCVMLAKTDKDRQRHSRRSVKNKK